VQRGFTLIELAIVLVIIGLLVGGVLVGRDLIQSAGINAVARDIDSYNVGAMTFRDKYGGIPGDITASKAQQFGLTISATNPGTTGEGDGDGVLGNGTIVNAGLGGEDTLFWRQLSDAQLIPFGSTADGTTLDTTAFAGNLATTVSTLTPLIPAHSLHGLRVCL
jgi:prepilin-type N-terminal cleavage/methylation domain-containing protein